MFVCHACRPAGAPAAGRHKPDGDEISEEKRWSGETAHGRLVSYKFATSFDRRWSLVQSNAMDRAPDAKNEKRRRRRKSATSASSVAKTAGNESALAPLNYFFLAAAAFAFVACCDEISACFF